ncbi:hypothetical protein FRAAL3829 [Frankia alni ACN14a]|uniref:Uncharacterized protein n=1 Tax=Frankia alni (strain DSM 45986 / CECT 9034 / ACN14a) TaxID=326424 RepID=Q0RJ41_FRAAA|nr:hypothetical protein FRAAL3829 [Frankia alni ACN14a]
MTAGGVEESNRPVLGADRTC